jgi:shikimate kinase
MSRYRPPQNIALIGFMATGKSAVGRLVAAQLGYDFVDTDALIETRYQKKIRDIFETEGEAQFRKYEKLVVAELVEFTRTVIATGGGMAANVENLEALKTNALVVCLWASPEIIWSRARRHSHRPLLQGQNPQEKIRSLLAARAPFYRQADVMINTERRSVNTVAQQVIYQFRLACKDSIPGKGVRKVRV